MPSDVFGTHLMNLSSRRCSVWACGSRITNTPVPEGADHDFLVKVPPEEWKDVADYLSWAGYVNESDSGDYHVEPGPLAFQSWRYTGAIGVNQSQVGEVNLLLTTDDEFVSRHREATRLARAMNLPVKADRIALFTAVLYHKGDWYDDETGTARRPGGPA